VTRTRGVSVSAVATVVLALALAGCGGGGGGSSSSSGPPCRGAALLAAVKAGAGHDVTATVRKTLAVRNDTVKCAQGYAGATFTSAAGSGDVFAVFKAAGSAWKYLSLGSADVCGGLAIPAAAAQAIGCGAASPSSTPASTGATPNSSAATAPATATTATPTTTCPRDPAVGLDALVYYESAVLGNNPPPADPSDVQIGGYRCADAGDGSQYTLVTLNTQTASGRFRVLMLTPPPSANQGSGQLGRDTEEGAPPGFLYVSCTLDHGALSRLGLPGPQPNGDPSQKNCGVIQ
jgi:hypothetical protein